MPDAGVPASSSAPATAFVVAMLEEFVRAGVRDLVVAPGSRSQALALAAAEFERAGLLRLHVRIDERGAGFLALGLALDSRHPSIVVTTSGTAVANLHPAVLEAHHAGVPLIALTADRPAELRGIRSNQTTMQPGIFAGAVRLERDVTAPEGAAGESDAAARLARDAVAAALGFDAAGAFVAHPGPGPVHVNLQLREPLSSPFDIGGLRRRAGAASKPASRNPDGAPGFETRPPSSGAPQPAAAHGALIEPGPRTVVIAGAGAGAAAEEFARAGGWPLFAEVTSGAHFGPNLVVAYRDLLREPGFGDQVQRAVVFGHPTLSREVPALAQRDDVETIVVAPSGIEWFNPGRRVRRFERAVQVAGHPQAADERAWVGRWVHASRALVTAGLPEGAPLASGIDETGHVSDFVAQREYMKAQLAAVRAPITRRMLVDAVWAATWPHDRLVFGASRLIRSADRAVPGRRITAHANRGLAGIDGTVATALGIAIASQSADSRVEERAAQPDASRNPEAGRGVSAATVSRPAGSGAGGVTRALIGDLTLLHDVGSLLIGDGEARPRLQLIVGNDGGGTIFDALEVAGTAPADAFDRVQFTPQQVDLAALAAAYGWDYARATTRGELDEALGTRIDGLSILEVPLQR
ncbi:2-succinyl-5-enolpyruvyl-6-hydroxy-3-cyclohexene-1-carboxylic-acid synthase [Agromyces sp. SYSU K20354]|uniref:2-succinyl-5-enolpyruvyl-6-hydroxy-3- cyclohexene-1-carboxylic-acid synthase n=1 Tax=Agromyces cavernae TaxID=2898659 RepID=UPI001E631502|nr:2-succinyl-5-enolpyruvyl-6-hydroxy-3-cyclohexene-1-carboxylic-acid synthase [Agromyces cavernae]MCD2443488.1 2-succinyl-5-enolpyruvyl-6-hydroxy-3-cyclohexene-1-carboxylic-acid synthase [Agromyces cavernae]